MNQYDLDEDAGSLGHPARTGARSAETNSTSSPPNSAPSWRSEVNRAKKAQLGTLQKRIHWEKSW
jgi:hypothetical protein